MTTQSCGLFSCLSSRREQRPVLLSYHTHAMISSQPGRPCSQRSGGCSNVESHQEGHCLAAPGQNSIRTPTSRSIKGCLAAPTTESQWGVGSRGMGDGGGQNWSSGEMNVSTLLLVRNTRSALHRSELSVSCFIPVATHTA